jgi:hypothetical protein
MTKHKLSKEAQIKGLKNALKNPKTPKQLRPSIEKRLAKLTAMAVLLACWSFAGCWSDAIMADRDTLLEVAGGALLYLLVVVSAFLLVAIFWAWAALIRFAVREIRLKIVGRNTSG